ncbi:branched-chain amino acid ABC transporter substrate-binding protein [Bradyrhizobium sp. SSBR45G]|uniref:ABC transporter substrate-binding protein n=1 Tax=unclassified Bradyrhizobium TaxID=2631580 RepID=UPI002342A279|nr:MULTISPECIES: ABC transporter substrate-binding protein [unclassified Bradyrhizobium]GLH77161.1 branched-chain amino acid ABC transporter substrate-binding protein [Bradyrhizobium sp. SSBR45G]GLH83919.1 branched-chain amino acid ABC transporter substrate-binding protein [Bradyrhizobium sp. SSBR45R]
MSRASVLTSCSLIAATLLSLSAAHAQKTYDPGASDTEIKLGQSTPLSGPASAFGAGAGRAVLGYFEMLNERGGINGRKISFTQLDNAYSAPKAVEQSRKLIEDIGVLAEVGTIGTAPNVAIQKYLNSKKVPQLFITAGGRRFNDPNQFPWTVPLYPDFETEGRVMAKYILTARPEAKIGVLYQNDDFGRDYLKGLRAGLGAKASLIVTQVSYEVSDPTIDSQVVQLKSAGVDTLIEQSSAKAAAQSIRKVHELDWHPLHIIGGSTASVETVLKPAGLDASRGLVTTQFLKQPGDPAWTDDDEVKAYKIFLKKYAPSVNPDDYSVLVAYMNVNALEAVLKACGDQLTRENLIRQATSLHGERLPMMLPGITIGTKPGDYTPFRTLRIAVFDGTSWTLSGEPMTAD